MTRRGAIKYAKEIKAFQDGKDIQVNINEHWTDTDNPSFDRDRLFRIKPAKKIDVATERVMECIVDAFSTPNVMINADFINAILKDVYGDN